MIDVKWVARIAAEIADVIDVNVVARIETADRKEIAAGAAAAFARLHADARHVAQHIAQGDGGLFLDERSRNDGHTLRNIPERFRVLARVDFRRFVDRLSPHHDLGRRRRRLFRLGGLRLCVSGEHHRIGQDRRRGGSARQNP